MEDTAFMKAVKIEVRRVRVLSFLLAAGAVASFFFFDRTGEGFTVVAVFFCILMLAHHYSIDGINYRAMKRVTKWSRKSNL